MKMSLRIALRHLESEWLRVASKSDYQDALDFTAGLIRKFEHRGMQISNDFSNRELLRRVMRISQLVQQGLDLSELAANFVILRGDGEKAIARNEASDRIVSALTKKFPDREAEARVAQKNFLNSMISKALAVPIETIDSRLLEDRAFFEEAYAVVVPYLQDVLSQAKSLLADWPLEARIKKMQSTWDKSHKEGKERPFTALGDLIGCRTVTGNLPEMADVCDSVQKKLGGLILAKDNKYGEGKGYNAMHYALHVNRVVIEYQVKAKENLMETALSHELTYSDDKFKDKFKTEPLSPAQKALIRTVIDLSTQLSMQDFKTLGFPVYTTKAPPQGRELLYGERLPPEVLQQRVRLALEGMHRYARLISGSRRTSRKKY